MIRGDVLVLNKSYQPLYIIDLKEAINLLFQDRAKIVLQDYGMLTFQEWLELSEVILEDHDYDYIQTIRKRLIRPYLLYMHTNNYQPRYSISFSRKLIQIRDKGICQYCGKKISKHDQSLDHVIPKSKGGKTTWSNIVLACKRCNHKKKDKTPEEANMRLLSTPKPPKLIQLIMNNFKDKDYYSLWRPFLEKPVI